ncbi:MAG: conserved rane protein of unknown function [Nocardia sp.]|uniref:hypothetical protein n=1 Tax=Nocardia sp. TaxID=1821 RepID=UPI0026389746|nr:hypothetical protein [Nocardia sp.]MCU1646637.1 conserved rane protein of unknown function [Nocardia sp.]
MPRGSRRLLLPALGLVVALLTGCSGSAGAAPRTPGDHVTTAEAAVLAGLLHGNFRSGGADFEETAPYAEGSVLTLTGSVDFVRSVGSARATTTYRNGQPPDSRTIFFTTKDIWFGDVPNLAQELAAAGLPAATYVRRPLAPVAADGQGQLIDVLAQLVLNLSARSSDDPQSFEKGNYTWQGSRSINGRPASVYSLAGGARVAVGADKQLLQYVTPLPDQTFQVTMTLPQHGRRSIDLPGDTRTVSATDHPDIAAKVGV